MPCTVAFKSPGLTVACAKGTLLTEAARRAGIPLQSSCGGTGTCGRCRVRILTGSTSPPTSAEAGHITDRELAGGFRLACQIRIAGDITVDIPSSSLVSRHTIPVREMKPALPPLEPAIHDHIVAVADAGISDSPRWTDLIGHIKQHEQNGVTIEAAVQGSLRNALGTSPEELRLSVRKREVISVRRYDSIPFGLAIDLGTTTLAGYLMDLEKGKLLSARAILNPQHAFGDDVMSRIAFAINNGDRDLRRAAVDGLNALIAALCVEPERIVDLTLVGNTAMHHILLGLPVKQLGRAPYQPWMREPRDCKARDLGLGVAPGAYLHLPPPVGGFVGSDHLAVIIAAGIHRSAQTVLALDIGTNTEAALVHRGRITSISCASGPALEGGHIIHGCRAVPGAIDQVSLSPAGIACRTIGSTPPLGLCGSGIIDAVACLLRLGIIDRKGALTAAADDKHASEGKRSFTLVSAEQSATGRAITISQKDVGEIQLAKAAIRTGIDLLLGEAGITGDAVDEVILTGGFGTVLDPASAADIGMFPPFKPDRIRSMENGAGAGAMRCLISEPERAEAANTAAVISHLELMTHPAFKKRFATAMYFPG